LIDRERERERDFEGENVKDSKKRVKKFCRYDLVSKQAFKCHWFFMGQSNKAASVGISAYKYESLNIQVRVHNPVLIIVMHISSFFFDT